MVLKRLLPWVNSIAWLALTVAWSEAQQTPADKEIRALAERPEVEKAFRTIVELEPQTEAELIELTEIPAPPFKEEVRAKRYAEKLREIGGFESVAIDEVGNVIARRKGQSGDGRTMAIAAHLDTVFPEGTDVTVRREGDRLYAPGVGDDTRGLVLVLAVMRALNAAEIRTKADVLVVGTVGEEGLGDLRGVKHLFREGGQRIDAFINVDGGSTDRVLTHALGSHRYRVTFKGPGGHSWGAFGLANPAHALGRAAYYFDEEASEFVIAGPRTSFNIGRIGGGTSINSIPFESWMEVDMRSVDRERLKEIDAIFQRSVQRALEEENEQRLEGEPLVADVDFIGNRPSGDVAPESRLIQIAMAATRYFGVEPTLGTGSTDANIPISLGIPATTIGRGGEGEGGHSLGEWWSNKDGHLGIQKALLILLAMAEMAE